MLVEDNAQNRYLVTYLLEHHGFVVITASDGRQALEILRNQTVDIVLLDVQLPGMDGFEVARALRGDARFADTPLVAISSFAMPAEQASALSRGFDGYIAKPIDPDRFVTEVRSFIR